MIKINGEKVNIGNFPDGTMLIKYEAIDGFSKGSKEVNEATVSWLYEKPVELLAVYYLIRHLQEHGIKEILLTAPNYSNADVVKKMSKCSFYSPKVEDEVKCMLNTYSQLIVELPATISAYYNHEVASVDMLDSLIEEAKKESRISSEFASHTEVQVFNWKYSNDMEIVKLISMAREHKRTKSNKIALEMPYIPNARQDRVKSNSDVFTLKYFCELINKQKFNWVKVRDPHSNVSTALIDRVITEMPVEYIERAIDNIHSEKLLMFYPDEGAMKRYSEIIKARPYVFGLKKRSWETGEIKSLSVVGETELIEQSDTILIVDDICSKGGTFWFSAKELKAIGAKKIYLYVTHCENTVFEGQLIESDLIERIYTTDTIYKDSGCEKVQVIK